MNGHTTKGSGKAKQAKSLLGNQNARKSKNGSKVIRLSASDVDLLVDFFASEGHMAPATSDFSDAVHYAIMQVYGRQVERDRAIIL